jgi:SPP1 family predicted phage head-tail adaptor
MPLCSKIRKKKRQYCIGDLRDEIILQDRSITPPFNGVGFSETFTDQITILSAINTVKGKVYFDGVGTETPITHEIGFRFIDGITAETWILYDGRRLDILNVEDLDERHEWLLAQCTDRGLENKQASQI